MKNMGQSANKLTKKHKHFLVLVSLLISLVTSWLMQNKYKELKLQKQPFTDGTKHSRMDQVKFVEDSL